MIWQDNNNISIALNHKNISKLEIKAFFLFKNSTNIFLYCFRPLQQSLSKLKRNYASWNKKIGKNELIIREKGGILADKTWMNT